MTLLDELDAKLLDNKERLRRLDSVIDDLLKAALHPDSELGSSEYLAEAAEFRQKAQETRELIAELEKLRSARRGG
ncbi:hypothetical protein [Bradyrhizobium sp. sGM-13]|uniref:hypothetical protein n=1 Tax=Bradyrhizobium sp. sGM-13 TaxID=2831781 RepID=UPI001BCDF34A|nr:hypothetical protein [Bradyrhizobium sp. sGM-13]